MEALQDNPAGIYSEMVERAFLVGIRFSTLSEREACSHLRELEGLVWTMGLETVGRDIVNLREPNSKFLIGSGKAGEIARAAEESGADCIIFDDDLSPSQQRNWEHLANTCVIDRREVILDIFAARASTREAVLQVGLARMEYSLPRLTRAWTHLSRQRGGARGTRGEGETQLEADRRIVLHKIAKMKRDLAKVQSARDIQRKRREELPIPVGSIVGYTNAGKSSLLRALTDADVFVEDKLFATLDPTTRRISLPGGKEVLLSDTVGFIRKLPHGLVEAFKSTLEETVLAAFLLHVIDASDPEFASHISVTNQVLEEIGAGGKPKILVFNKIDSASDLDFLRARYADACFISAKTGEGLEKLIERIGRRVFESGRTMRFEIPHTRYDLAALIHRTGQVIREDYVDDTIRIAARVPEKTKNLLTRYLCSG
jgi:GTPase